MRVEEYVETSMMLSRFRQAARDCALCDAEVAAILWLEPEAWRELATGNTVELIGDDVERRMRRFVGVVSALGVLAPGCDPGTALRDADPAGGTSMLAFMTGERDGLARLSGAAACWQRAPRGRA